jgi:hypothetical protein
LVLDSPPWIAPARHRPSGAESLQHAGLAIDERLLLRQQRLLAIDLRRHRRGLAIEADGMEGEFLDLGHLDAQHLIDGEPLLADLAFAGHARQMAVLGDVRGHLGQWRQAIGRIEHPVGPDVGLALDTGRLHHTFDQQIAAAAERAADDRTFLVQDQQLLGAGQVQAPIAGDEIGARHLDGAADPLIAFDGDGAIAAEAAADDDAILVVDHQALMAVQVQIPFAEQSIVVVHEHAAAGVQLALDGELAVALPRARNDDSLLVEQV